MLKLLIIDDDQSLVEVLSSYFTQTGYSVTTAYDGKDGLRSLYNDQPDLVLLDITMPKRDGWETLERIRDISNTPVIMLTSKSDEQDILRGFSQGADDYVVKPFSFAQLGARVQAVLLRTKESLTDNDDFLEEGDLVVDLKLHRVRRGEVEISLSPTEFKLLTTLMKKAGEIMSASELVTTVWGPHYSGEVGHVRRYIWYLRKKIEPNPESPVYLHNERGYGYRFQAIQNQ